MAVRDSLCMYSVVKNISGESNKFFGFLPPHGQRLDADEEFAVWGNITEAILRGRGRLIQRTVDAFEASLTENAGDLEIRQTPNPVMVDGTTDDAKMLYLNNGVLFASDPCYSSSAISDSL